MKLLQSEPGYDGPLCGPIDVRVEFWKLTYGSPPDGGDSSKDPDYYFSMERAGQTRIRHDGREIQDIKAPAKLYDDRSPCVGALVTVTAGEPLAEKELPRTIQLRDGSLGENDLVDFRTERVATLHVSRPEAAHVCGPDGTPTADPDDVPSPTSEPEPDPYALSAPFALPEDLRTWRICPCPASASASGPAARAVRPFPALSGTAVAPTRAGAMRTPRCVSSERGG